MSGAGAAPYLVVLAPLRLEALLARQGAPSARVVRVGAGPERARRAAGRAAALISGAAAVAVTGFCGAVADGLLPGDGVVASEVVGPGPERTALPAGTLAAAALRRQGLRVYHGPLASVGHLVAGDERMALAAGGALAVDMEAASLLRSGALRDRPVVVARVVVDTPSRELLSVHTLRGGLAALPALRQVAAALAGWAASAEPALGRRVLLASPRSFCAGVERAIATVEEALSAFGAPVYVRRQIVHNTHVVADLESRGAVFVEELDEVPEEATVVLAAHGVAPSVRAEADRRRLKVVDATCPLVAKVHYEARRFAAAGHQIVLVGHRDHEEVEGTLGEAADAISVVASPAELDRLELSPDRPVAFLTQTTLAVDEVAEVADHLRARRPDAVGPAADDVCYASQNRQDAVREVARRADVLLVVGSPNSSNSNRLAEVAGREGCPAHLVEDETEVDPAWLAGTRVVGVTAGASAPEELVDRVVAAISALGPTATEEVAVTTESVRFSLPRIGP
jgi:4-hydroxy-3-methylbut-2-enyl diphosphate reductase